MVRRVSTSTFTAALHGRRFRFSASRGLFSGGRVDEGTRLLLDHLPANAPRSMLDVGCGYGALGLPIAARHPEARCLLVDRNLVALEHARHNVAANGPFANVTTRPSLGYRDV